MDVVVRAAAVRRVLGRVEVVRLDGIDHAVHPESRHARHHPVHGVERLRPARQVQALIAETGRGGVDEDLLDLPRLRSLICATRLGCLPRSATSGLLAAAFAAAARAQEVSRVSVGLPNP